MFFFQICKRGKRTISIRRYKTRRRRRCVGGTRPISATNVPAMTTKFPGRHPLHDSLRAIERGCAHRRQITAHSSSSFDMIIQSIFCVPYTPHSPDAPPARQSCHRPSRPSCSSSLTLPTSLLFLLCPFQHHPGPLLRCPPLLLFLILQKHSSRPRYAACGTPRLGAQEHSTGLCAQPPLSPPPSALLPSFARSAFPPPAFLKNTFERGKM